MITTAFLLISFGLLMVYSASFPLGIDISGDPYHFLKRQLVWFVLGTFLFFIVLHIPYRFYRKLVPYLVLLSLVVLVLVLLVGEEVKGAQRWLSFGPVTIQPSEFIKLAVILYLAHVYSNKHKYIDQFVQGVLPPLIIVVCMFGLIILQPDLGTAAMVLLAGGTIVFLSGARWFHLFILGGLSAGVVAWLAFETPYRMQRLIAFQDPFSHQMDSGGYQLIQAYIAMAHGGLTGTGLGKSAQKMHYLPEPHTDFIFPVIVEELGIFGLLFVVGCFLVLLWRGFITGVHASDMFGKLLAFGITFFFMFQALLNLMAVSGMMPITGVPLPFISYGGSSLIVSMISLGIVANIARKVKTERLRAKKEEVA
ncbi:putative lipid II flippase FtsW [Aliibacillus thermotolerans]|nr:putative lipid II flippase FtsW [Aliibacillus thermotolerans]